MSRLTSISGRRWSSRLLLLLLLVPGGTTWGLTLWSTPESYLGTGQFFGPGEFLEEQELFAVVIHNMTFVTERDFLTPFENNGPAEPNLCAEKAFRGEVDGRLSNGLLINENADTCLMNLAGVELLPAVVAGGPYMGQQISVTSDDGHVVMTMDLALDLGVGERGVVVLPFYGTTGSLEVPYSLQTQQGGKGIDRAGVLESGSVIHGRIGDFNGDGWIDGSLVAVGTLPLDSPIYPGQPYAMYRTFETDIPIAGAVFGNVRELVGETAAEER